MQNSALSFSFCMDNKSHQVEHIMEQLSKNYKVKYNDAVELITIRHYSAESLDKVLKDREILVEQKNRTTIQLIIKS
jgi:aspartate kinase